MRKHVKRGYSLVELVVVIIIIGILAGVGLNFGGKQIAKARIQSASNNIKIVANDVESAVIDVGFLDKNTAMTDTSARTNYFKTWDNKFLSCPLNLDTLVPVPENDAFGSDFCGCYMDTESYADPWGNELRIYYMIPVDGEMYRIVVASAGPNSLWAEDAAYGYINGNFEDDIVMIMEPRQ